MTTENNFTVPSVSIAGAPTINWEFTGHVARAECMGAKVCAVLRPDGNADLRVTDATGEVLADIIVRKMPRDESITASLMNVGTALLWSHLQWLDAKGSGGTRARSFGGAVIARREVTDDDIEAIAAEWAASGQPTMVEFARRALESGDERARQRFVDAIEARRNRARQHDGSTGWRAGVEAAVRVVKMRQNIMPDIQTPGYRQALRDVLVHLEAMLERGTETSVEDSMRGDQR